ncbi:MAG: hypothetical protein JO193_06150 [Candidatus Eremiobacteraeota bacterium]|nr:hypothetical protein [Candidatus Eremiobacteraeota bacterium]
MRRGRLVASAGALLLASTAPAFAMPPFAEAYGMRCNVCHTQVPALNAYGRYVQRTGYASLDYHTLHRSTPFWVGESANYDSQNPAEPHHWDFGNLALHAAGAFDQNFTFHAQQWIVQNGQSGGVDTLWLTYNNIFHRDGHLFIGKMPAPGPSPYSQWFDLASFSTPEITVGEHVYQLDANRWGTKLNYVHGSLDFEAGYFSSGADLSGFGDFTWVNDKTLIWKLAHANPEQPLEFGVLGSRGSWPLAEGGFDQYWTIGGYVQRDPTNGFPGFLGIYQSGYDQVPSPGAGPAGSTAATLELYEPIGRDALIGFRKEWTNDGLGTQTQTGNIDFNYHIARYLHFYAEAAMAQNATPTWRYMLWWTIPLQKVK